MGDISSGTILKYDFGSYKGYIAENYVAQELLAAGHERLFCWEGRTSEIEFLIQLFLIQLNDHLVPIEVKAGSNTQSKSLSVFREKYKPELQCVLSAKQLHFEKDKGIQRVPLYLTHKIARVR